MTDIAALDCICGGTRIEVHGKPFLVTECLCDSCRQAAGRVRALGGPEMLTSYGATACAEYRKDRVRIVFGEENLKDLRLSPNAGSRRVIATCCKTPMFLELKGAHWLSVYLGLWPERLRPLPWVRTMTGDLDDVSALPSDIPNLKTHSIGFYARLMAAWAAMGFRNPKIRTGGSIDDGQ